MGHGASVFFWRDTMLESSYDSLYDAIAEYCDYEGIEYYSPEDE